MTEGKSWCVHEAGFISSKGQMLVCLTGWTHLGSDFGGLIVLLLSRAVHSSIIYFFSRYFLSFHWIPGSAYLGTRLFITPCSQVRRGDGQINT